MPVEEFLRDYWEKKPLFIRRDDPTHYTQLPTLDEVDSILSTSRATLEGIRLVIDGKETPVSTLGVSFGWNGIANSLEALYERYRNGSTIVLNALEGRWEPLARLTARLGVETNCRFQANLYLTPAGNQGFTPHYDTHDVFIAQVHGTKSWKLHGAPYPLPLRTQPFDRSGTLPDGPVEELELRPGDLLYLPRGTIHSATSNETASAHVTIGVHPVIWSEMMADAVRQVFEDDVRFREGLPLAFAAGDELPQQAEKRFAELVDVLHERLSAKAMVDNSLKRAASLSLPQLRHHLLDLEQAAEVDAGTRVSRRPGTQWNLTVAEGQVCLDFNNKTVQFPAYVADEVRYVAEHAGGGLTADDVRGNLDLPGRLVLVRTLLREGFLTLA
ncbi:cupin domain-containing protein [Kitasatospora sp. NPDC056800]|uniref:cupin domain-containing protein n=1 Tax=Kitasatospora sp. NPDC056800 TaxID=3345948 RepID=UPI00368409BC